MRATVAGLALMLPLLCTGISPGVLSGQSADPPGRTKLYVTLGGGISTNDLLAHASLSADTPIGFVSLRTATAAEFTIWGPADDVSDVALMFGTRRRGARSWISVAGGPAIAWRTVSRCVEPGSIFGCAQFEDAAESAVGIGFDVTVGRSLSRAVGLGVSLLGNMSRDRSFVGLGLNLHLGRLR